MPAPSPLARHIQNVRYWRTLKENRLDRSASRQDTDRAHAMRAALDVPSPKSLPGMDEEAGLDFTMGA
jgi:hypothetical protein